MYRTFFSTLPALISIVLLREEECYQMKLFCLKIFFRMKRRTLFSASLCYLILKNWFLCYWNILCVLFYFSGRFILVLLKSCRVRMIKIQWANQNLTPLSPYLSYLLFVPRTDFWGIMGHCSISLFFLINKAKVACLWMPSQLLRIHSTWFITTTTVSHFDFVSGKTVKLVRNVEWERLGDYRRLVGSKMQYKSVSVKPVSLKKTPQTLNYETEPRQL